MDDSNKKKIAKTGYKRRCKSRKKKKNKMLVCLYVFSSILLVVMIVFGLVKIKKDDTKQNDTYVVTVELPWENGGKEPKEYSIDEFEELTNVQQELFYEWFDSEDEFQQWMSNAKKEKEVGDVIIPWENGEKQPNEYTMYEFEELTDVQQELFFEWFDSVDEFERWYDAANGKE